MPNEQIPSFNANRIKDHAANLKAAQAGGLKNAPQNIKKIRDNVKAVINFGSLTAYVEPFTDWLFGIALTFAIIKDIFDLADTALIAAGGLGIALIFITTTICSLAIWFIMFIAGSSGKKREARLMVKTIVLIAATMVEYLPGIDILPIESLTVVVIVWMTLKDRQKAAEEKAQQAMATETTDALPA